jgi:hypothetical protein
MPEGYQYSLIPGQGVLVPLLSSCQRILDSLYRHLQEGCPSNQERGNLFAIPQRKQKVKIKIQEATVYFKTYRRFTFK